MFRGSARGRFTRFRSAQSTSASGKKKRARNLSFILTIN
eukprot:UN22661